MYHFYIEIHFVPISGYTEKNILNPPPTNICPWYSFEGFFFPFLSFFFFTFLLAVMHPLSTGKISEEGGDEVERKMLV
jgi:translation elongation factor EF-1alpha